MREDNKVPIHLFYHGKQWITLTRVEAGGPARGMPPGAGLSWGGCRQRRAPRSSVRREVQGGSARIASRCRGIVSSRLVGARQFLSPELKSQQLAGNSNHTLYFLPIIVLTLCGAFQKVWQEKCVWFPPFLEHLAGVSSSRPHVFGKKNGDPSSIAGCASAHRLLNRYTKHPITSLFSAFAFRIHNS